MIQRLDFETAVRVYRDILHNPGMVMTLESIHPYDDLNLLTGHAQALLGDFSKAQDYYLRSSKPIAAYELKRDLMEYDQAMSLAMKLAPHEISRVAKEYGQQLELEGKYGDAQKMFEKALETSHQIDGSEEEKVEHQISCSVCLTRIVFKTGDLFKGMALLNQCDDMRLLEECGDILVELKQFKEASIVYERAQKWEKVAHCYIESMLSPFVRFLTNRSAKNWAKLTNILNQLNNTKVFLAYARANEGTSSLFLTFLQLLRNRKL